MPPAERDHDEENPMTLPSLTELARQRQLRAEYVARLNRVLDYIQAHLTQELLLTAIAQVAAFSPYHFHRLIKAMMGETLSQFIARLRVERAARLIVNDPGLSMTEEALDCGYSSSATFSRAFREAFAMTPSEWRSDGYRKRGNSDSNLSKTDSKLGKAEFSVICEPNLITYQPGSWPPGQARGGCLVRARNSAVSTATIRP